MRSFEWPKPDFSLISTFDKGNEDGFTDKNCWQKMKRKNENFFKGLCSQITKNIVRSQRDKKSIISRWKHKSDIYPGEEVRRLLIQDEAKVLT